MKQSKKQTTVQQLKSAQTKLQLAETRMQLASLRDANKARKAMLATYSAADRGRRNKDWRASAVSADSAIIPDSQLLNARSRQMVRDSWIASSAVDAYCRNVVGCGVIPIPQAKDEKGNLLIDLNRHAMLDFWAWAGDKQWCDVESDQTFWQMEELAERERVTVGECFWIWSYEPNRLQDGRIDLSQPIGLKIQAFEAEQLNPNLISHFDEATGRTNEVRGGIEVDRLGRPIAYHVYAQNPNDYGWTVNLQSRRILAGRVLHYFKKKRVRQKRGVTDLAPVLQDARDLTRQKEAQLWRSIMEACIGMTVKRDAMSLPGGTISGMQPRMSGDTGQTASGMPTIDIVPGMIADPGAGVTLESFVPQAPGNTYEPFQRLGLRGVAAGAGLSYGQISRDFTQGTYSGQRQEMLEDRKVFEPLQELIAHNLLFPVYRIFFALSVAEGRLKAPGFESSPMRFTSAEYVAPPPTWIDPKAEADALEKLIELRVITREEIAHLRGTRLSDILAKIAAERDEADKNGIEFSENHEDKGIEFQREVVMEMIAEKKGTVTNALVNGLDLQELSKNTGLPVNPDYVQPLLPVEDGQGNIVTGEVVTDADGNAIGAQIEQKPTTQPSPAGNSGDNADPSKAGLQAENLLKLAAKVDVPPNYRLAASEIPQNCAICQYFKGGKCTAYNGYAVDDEHLCDSFANQAVQGGDGRVAGGRQVDNPGDFAIDSRAIRGVQ